MTLPNRYDGKGRLLPDGTVSGRWVMRNGKWTDFRQRQYDEGPSIKRYKESVKVVKFLAYLALVVIVLSFVAALSGCSVNTVVVNNADIGVQTAWETCKHVE